MRTIVTLVVGIFLGAGGLILAQQSGHGPLQLKVLSATDMTEKLDGKDAKVSMLELTLEPGQSSLPHRHPGPVFGYILEGEYQWAINDQPVKQLKTGDTFYEPAMSLHRVSRNSSDRAKARVLAIMVHPRDAKQLSIPEKKH